MSDDDGKFIKFRAEEGVGDCTMTEAELLMKIHEDVEVLKRNVEELRAVIVESPEIREEIREKVESARRRIAKGIFVKNEDLLKEFGLG